MMADRLEAYADWLVQNEGKQGTPEFETVKDAYLEMRGSGGDAPSVSASPDVVESPQINVKQYERQGRKAVTDGVQAVQDALKAGSSIARRAATGPEYAPPDVQAPIAGAPPPNTPEFAAWEKRQNVERRKRGIRKKLSALHPKDSGGAMHAAVIGGAAANRAVEPFLRPLAPVPGWGPVISAGGQIAAGALGAGAGVYGYYGGLDALKDAGVDTPYKRVGALEAAQLGLKEARDDAMFAGALSSVGRVARGAGRKAIDMFTGVGPAQRQYAAEIYSKFGVGLSNVNLSERPLVRGFNKIVGVMPFIGTPAAKSRDRLAGEFLAAKDRLFVMSGPTLTKPEASKHLIKAAKRKFGAFTSRANKLYSEYRTLADEAGEIFPTEKMQMRAIETLDDVTKNLPVNRDTGAPMIPNSLQSAWKAYTDAVDEVVMYGDRVTLPQLETIEGALYAAAAQAKEASKGGKKAAGAIQHAILNLAREAEEAQRAIDPEGPGAAALAALGKADGFYSKMMGVFDSKTAQQIKRTDPDALTTGARRFKKPTWREDEVFDMMFSTKSAEAQKELLDVVGKPAYRKAVQTHVTNAFNSSITDKGFNSAKFLETTGLGNSGVREGTENAMNAAYRLAGIDRERLELFADFASKITNSDVPDLSTFVARRGMLGGVRSALKGIVGIGIAGGGSGAVGGIPAVATTIGLRWMTGQMNKPVYKQLMEEVARNAPESQGFRNSLARILRLGLEDMGVRVQGTAEDVEKMAEDAYDRIKVTP